jgi:hypothetical protein
MILASRWRHILLLVGLLSLLVLLIQRTWGNYSANGLFFDLGVDFGLFYAQAMVLRSGDPAAIYDVGAINRQLQALTLYTGQSAGTLSAGPLPTLPVFVWLFIPFTLPSPPVGFAIWTGLNLLAGVQLMRRLSQELPKTEWYVIALVFLTMGPVVWTLSLGQVSLLMACAVGEIYLALRLGRDFRAGLWIACLLLRPQYGILIGPLLILKRRWSAVAGAMAGAVVVLSASVIVAGLPTLIAYDSSFGLSAPFRGGPHIYPLVMINWHSLILHLFPDIDDRTGVVLTILLGAATVLSVVPAWRGAWNPAEEFFPAKMSLLFLATLIAGYHNNAYAAVVLALPLAAVLGVRQTRRFTRVAIVTAALAPSAYWALRYPPRDYSFLVNPLLTLLLLICFISLLAEVRLRRSSASGAVQSGWRVPTVVNSDFENRL